MNRSILCVGALTLDTIFRLDELPQQAGKYLPSQAVQTAAGMATSAASAIARLGGLASLWASAGDDATGSRAIADIELEGVDCSHVRRIGGARTAFSSILIDARGERIIVPCYDPQLASSSDVTPMIDAANFAAVMVDVRWPFAAAFALQAAKAAGIPAILDADTAPIDILEKLLPLASHIVASEPAAISLTGTKDLSEATHILAKRYGTFTAVTAGANGCFWCETPDDAVQHIEGFAVEAIDTLAAGDVFHGAFALGLVEGKDYPDVIRFANAAAAIKCSRFGGRQGTPTRREVTALLIKQAMASA